jgi:hypothetical protein
MNQDYIRRTINYLYLSTNLKRKRTSCAGNLAKFVVFHKIPHYWKPFLNKPKGKLQTKTIENAPWGLFVRPVT